MLRTKAFCLGSQQFLFMNRFTFSILLATVLLWCACDKSSDCISTNYSAVSQYAVSRIDSSLKYLHQIKADSYFEKENKRNFLQARKYYKQTEPFARYVNAQLAHKVNGPALPLFGEDNGRIFSPMGLQAIEEQVFANDFDSALFNYQITTTAGFLQNLRKTLIKHPMTADRYVQAVHQQLITIISLGITGFDTPTSLIGIEESVTSIETLKTSYEIAAQDTIIYIDQSVDEKFTTACIRAMDYLKSNVDFESFDRYTFVREYFNPLYAAWAEVSANLSHMETEDSHPLNIRSTSFFEKNTFNVRAFRAKRPVTDQEIELGRKLFYDPSLSDQNQLSCASCHIPKLSYTDGLKTAINRQGHPQSRNTPTLINSVFQRKQFWDGRSVDLESQIRSVITNKDEFNSGLHQISKDVLLDSNYVNQFMEVYGETKRTSRNIARALSSYVSTIQSFDSRFDKNMRGEESTFSDQEIEGMNLFMGKALCATCHFVPLFNGTVPPIYEESEMETLGVPAKADNKTLDSDMGFYRVYRSDLHARRFKTPTLRNVEFTAPYMHNGVYSTLEEVVDFYDVGGGIGLGLDVPNQTLPEDSLHLSAEEKEALIAFMKTLSDPVADEEY